MKKLVITLILLLFAMGNVFAEENTPFNEEEKSNEIINSEVVQNEIKKDTFDKDEITTYKTFKITDIDKTSDKKNAFIIFTPLFGKTTNSDTKGYEAVIIDNKIVKLNQFNTFIPRNGYVISGHGKAKKFITDELFEGADVDIDFKKGEFKLVVHPDNYLHEAIYRLDTVKKLYENSDKEVVDTFNMNFFISRSEEILNRTKKIIQFHDYENAKKMTKDSVLYSDKAVYFSLEFKPEEFRAAWVYPYQKNEDEVRQIIDNIGQLDIENIFLEVYYNGTTIYKSEVAEKYGLPAQNRYYKDFDALETWVKVAKEKNKNLYVSFNAINIENPPKSTIKSNIVKVHPEWILNTKTAKKEGYFLNPANKEVQNYFEELINEVTQKYEIAGVNIKGLNRPENNREISEFVNKMIDLRKTNENLKLSFNVYPNSADITTWHLDENVTVMPVLTSPDDDFAKDFLNETIERANSATIYPIYEVLYQEQRPRKFYEQLTVARKLGLNGVILYDLDSLNKEYHDALKLSVFRAPSKPKKRLYEKEEKENK